MSKFIGRQIMEAVMFVEAGFGLSCICRDIASSNVTFYNWRPNYGGVDVPMTPRIKELEKKIEVSIK